jgi:rhodanese-related sulfurtransferase
LKSASASQASQQIENGAVLIDVRDPGEWAAGHAPQALHVPLGRLLSGDTPETDGRPIITVCRSGSRSSQAAAALAARGLEVTNLSGGMNAWQRAGLPVVTNGGAPGRVA